MMKLSVWQTVFLFIGINLSKSYSKKAGTGDWNKASGTSRGGRGPNTLNGLQIAIPRKHQGKGLSAIILDELLTLAREQTFDNVTVPVRPSLKSEYPIQSIDRYITWKRDDELPFDPWLRVHVRRGAR